MKLVLVDFDGTVYRGDSFLDFVRFAVGALRAMLGFAVLAPIGAMKLIGWADGEDTKRRFTNWFFGSYSESELKTLGRDFAQANIPKKLYPKAFQQLAEWRDDPDTQVVIVSASLAIWLEPFVQHWGFDLLSTRLAFVNGQYARKFANKNCNGPEKAKQILANYTLSDYEKVEAYGNSKGDLHMFELAEETFYRPFV